MQNLKETLNQIGHHYPLGEGWQEAELFNDEVVLGALRIHLVGLSSQGANSKGLVAAAASLSAPDVHRAWFELLERAAIVEYLEKLSSDTIPAYRQDGTMVELSCAQVFPSDTLLAKLSKSNAVACGLEWKTACESAYLEMMERDRLLRGWLGRTKVEVVELPSQHPLYELKSHYQMYSCRFSESLKKPSVSGVFGIPLEANVPLLCGFGASLSDDSQASLAKASQEVLQRLGFLWGESLPTATPPISATPDFHQEWSLSPEGVQTITEWLNMARESTAPQNPEFSMPIEECSFIDFTPSHLRGKISVAKAFHPEALPLFFGEFPQTVFGEIPKNRSIHFIA